MVDYFIVISSAATVFIAIFTFLNLKMYRTLQTKDEEYKNQMSDLFTAIVISNLLSGNSDLSLTFPRFKKEYKGITKIFDNYTQF